MIPDLGDQLAVLDAWLTRLGSREGDESRACIQRIAELVDAPGSLAGPEAALQARVADELEHLVAAIGRLVGRAATLHGVDVAPVVAQLRSFAAYLRAPTAIAPRIPGLAAPEAEPRWSLRALDAQQEAACTRTLAQLEPLLDAMIASDSAFSAALAEQRADIVHAFRRADLAHMASGLRVLSAWLADAGHDLAELRARLAVALTAA